jgi:hypothetical protein
MYKQVTTPYIFHMEDDFELFKSGFIEKSIEILECDPKIMQVWLREQNDTNNHIIFPNNELYDIVGHGSACGLWHGFSFNSGLRKTADYKLLGDGGYSAVGHEVNLSEWYNERGFIAAITKQGYVRHIGQNRTVKDILRNTKPI